jgi:hypothetical protein
MMSVVFIETIVVCLNLSYRAEYATNGFADPVLEQV